MIIISIVFILNILACSLYSKECYTLGLILKVLGDGISLVYLCTRKI